jgi:hypothetical protein
VQSSILAHRPFTLFFCGRLLATTGFQMQSVAVGWQVCELTDRLVSSTENQWVDR